MEEEISENDELYEHFKYIAHSGQEPLRVDKFLMNFIGWFDNIVHICFELPRLCKLSKSHSILQDIQNNFVRRSVLE